MDIFAGVQRPIWRVVTWRVVTWRVVKTHLYPIQVDSVHMPQHE
jgi:hypothetical protein